MTIIKGKQPVKHEKKITDLTEEHKASAKGIRKRQVNLKLAEGAEATGELGGTMEPSDEQLEKINRFTRVTATADNVVAFSVMSCNDIYDRDDEKFTSRCIDDFSKLPAPYSPVGKSYMVDHEYKIANARGRIFDVGTKTVEGAKFLTNEVYVPKTAQYADFIESIDFGINWAVSVGVVIDAANCSICDGTVYSSRFFGSWCENGHEKGYFYVPGKEEDDGWGYYLPVDPSEKGAVKAMVDLSAPRDFYELSQVFLGAQYMAELAKEPSFKGMLKAASAAHIPLLGISEKQGARLPLPKESEKLVEAREKFDAETLDDGTVKWTDDAGLVWLFDPEDGQIGCLGKSEDDTDDSEEDESTDKWADDAVEALRARFEALGVKRSEDIAELLSKASEDDTESDDEDDDPVKVAESLDAVIDEIGDALDAGEYDQASDLCDSADTIADKLLDLLGGVDADEEDDKGAKPPAKEASVTKNDVLKLIVAARLPESIKTAVEAAADDKALSVALSETGRALRKQAAEIVTLTPKAAAGDAYIKDVTATAISWFTKSRLDPKSGKGVDVTLAEKLVARCGGDIDLIKELSKDWEAEARRRFPVPRRASTNGDGPDDVNESKGAADLPPELTEVRTDPRVAALHSK